MMNLRIIPRSNGSAFRGDYRTMITPAGHGAPGAHEEYPHRHEFELYVSPNDFLILIIAFFEGGQCRYRHGQRFRKLETVGEFLERYDPCQHLGFAAMRDISSRASLRKNYVDRSERFLQKAADRLRQAGTVAVSA